MHTHSMFKDTYILNYWGKGEEEQMGPFRREKWGASQKAITSRKDF